MSKEDAIVKQLENTGRYLKEIKEGILGGTLTLKDIETHLAKQDSEIVNKLEDVEKHLQRQDVKMKQGGLFTVAVFSGSIAIAGVVLGLSGLHQQGIGLIVVGVAVMGWSLWAHYKVGKSNVPK